MTLAVSEYNGADLCSWILIEVLLCIDPVLRIKSVMVEYTVKEKRLKANPGKGGCSHCLYTMFRLVYILQCSSEWEFSRKFDGLFPKKMFLLTGYLNVCVIILNGYCWVCIKGL